MDKLAGYPNSAGQHTMFFAVGFAAVSGPSV